jgi:CHASE3 domain sensor protein
MQFQQVFGKRQNQNTFAKLISKLYIPVITLMISVMLVSYYYENINETILSQVSETNHFQNALKSLGLASSENSTSELF